MSTYTVIVAILGILIGFITQAIQTGSFLSIITIPTTWLPYFSIALTFVGAFSHSLINAGSLTTTTLFNALVAALTALAGLTVGVTVHQHLKTGAPANDNGNNQSKAA
jgi:hypothetical protein